MCNNILSSPFQYALVQPGAAGRKALLNWKVLPNLVSNMQDKYKVYNLCSERLYDASLFEGKVNYHSLFCYCYQGFKIDNLVCHCGCVFFNF